MARSKTRASGGRERRSPAALLGAALAIGLLAVSLPLATADSPDNFSAGDEYVETVPTAKGPHVAKRKKRHAGSGGSLSGAVEAQLRRRGGEDADLLAEVATSAQLGAPQDDGGQERKRTGRENRLHGESDSRADAAVPSAAIKALNDDGGIGRLVTTLLAITALGLGGLGYQRHRNRKRS